MARLNEWNFQIRNKSDVTLYPYDSQEYRQITSHIVCFVVQFSLSAMAFITTRHDDGYSILSITEHIVCDLYIENVDTNISLSNKMT